MEVTRKIAGYVANASLEDFPPEALDVAKGGIIDCVACMLAGSREPLTDILCRFVRTTGGKLSSTVVGKGFKTSAPEAALVNAAAAHALDYDDITPPMKGHPSVVLLPALLALARICCAQDKRDPVAVPLPWLRAPGGSCGAAPS